MSPNIRGLYSPRNLSSAQTQCLGRSLTSANCSQDFVLEKLSPNHHSEAIAGAMRSLQKKLREEQEKARRLEGIHQKDGEMINMLKIELSKAQKEVITRSAEEKERYLKDSRDERCVNIEISDLRFANQRLAESVADLTRKANNVKELKDEVDRLRLDKIRQKNALDDERRLNADLGNKLKSLEAACAKVVSAYPIMITLRVEIGRNMQAFQDGTGGDKPWPTGEGDTARNAQEGI